MTKLLCWLKDHPGAGLFSSISGVLQTFIETSTPVLQYLGLLVGLMIGLVTLIIKLRELLRDGNEN